MSDAVLSEQQHRILDFDRAATMRVDATVAAKRVAVVKEDHLLTKADIQTLPVKASKAPYTEPKTWFGNKCFNIQDTSKASSITISRYVYEWKFVKNEKRDGTCHQTALRTSGFHGPRSF
eukprot:7695250-Pyramimonas_sp.AAC.1